MGANWCLSIIQAILSPRQKQPSVSDVTEKLRDISYDTHDYGDFTTASFRAIMRLYEKINYVLFSYNYSSIINRLIQDVELSY